MMLRFYTDTHIAKAVAEQSRQQGVDVIRCEEVEMAEADDFQHLAYAADHKRAIVTNDQGFSGHHRVWLAQGRHHAGIFLITKDKDNIGMIVTDLVFWHDAIRLGAANLENDVNDQIVYLP